jgi:hypothetical protein
MNDWASWFRFDGMWSLVFFVWYILFGLEPLNPILCCESDVDVADFVSGNSQQHESDDLMMQRTKSVLLSQNFFMFFAAICRR